MKRKILAIDIDVDKGTPYGISYFELPANVKEYINRCFDRNGILGFKYDRDSNQFGVVLKKKEDET